MFVLHLNPRPLDVGVIIYTNSDLTPKKITFHIDFMHMGVWLFILYIWHCHILNYNKVLGLIM